MNTWSSQGAGDVGVAGQMTGSRRGGGIMGALCISERAGPTLVLRYCQSCDSKALQKLDSHFGSSVLDNDG